MKKRSDYLRDLYQKLKRDTKKKTIESLMSEEEKKITKYSPIY